jgi:hypothetical protein
MPNEGTFTANVASCINEILQQRPALPFSRAEVERIGRGSRPRSDLTLCARFDPTRRVPLGEVKTSCSPVRRAATHEGPVEAAVRTADLAAYSQ